MKATLTRRHFLAGSLAMAGTATVAGCSGSSAQALYTVQAIVGIIVTLQQLTRRGIAPLAVDIDTTDITLSDGVLSSLAPQAQTTQTAAGVLQSVNIMADGLELHLTGGEKALQIGHAYAIEPIVTTDRTNDALAGGTLTILSVTGNTVRFRIENAQVKNGAKIMPLTWESSATIA
jgi:hypothetical protein